MFLVAVMLFMSFSIGTTLGLQKDNKLKSNSPDMCIIDTYAHQEAYSRWTEGERAAKDVACWGIGLGITCLCPPVGAIYGL